MNISGVRYTPAPDYLLQTGLLGWTSLVLCDQVRISEIGVRRTQSGRMALSFPVRDDGVGRRWTIVQPINDDARVALEREVLRQIQEQVP